MNTIILEQIVLFYEIKAFVSRIAHRPELQDFSPSILEYSRSTQTQIVRLYDACESFAQNSKLVSCQIGTWGTWSSCEKSLTSNIVHQFLLACN